MIPVIIEDMIGKLTDSRIKSENRQFYYTSLVEIQKQVSKAIKDYEEEKNYTQIRNKNI